MPTGTLIRLALLAWMTVALTCRPADAQMCAGRASFDLASTHFELDAGMNKSGHGVGVSVGHGTDNLFGIGVVLTHSADQADRVHMVAGTIGTDQPLSPDNKLHVCPMITVGYISGSDVLPNDNGRFGLSVAGHASMLAVNTPRMRVVPTLGLDFRQNVGQAVSLFAQDARRTYHTFTTGIGFLIWNRLSLVPRVVVPFGSISQTGVEVTVAYNLIRR
jgi:hypothetical protein